MLFDHNSPSQSHVSATAKGIGGDVLISTKLPGFPAFPCYPLSLGLLCKLEQLAQTVEKSDHAILVPLVEEEARERVRGAESGSKNHAQVVSQSPLTGSEIGRRWTYSSYVVLLLVSSIFDIEPRGTSVYLKEATVTQLLPVVDQRSEDQGDAPAEREARFSGKGVKTETRKPPGSVDFRPIDLRNPAAPEHQFRSV